MKLTTTPEELRAMQREIRELQMQKEEAIAAQDYETAANFRDKEKKLKDKYVSLEMKWRDELGAPVPDVTEENIAEIISSWTGVPVSRLVEEETSRLLHMEDEVHKRLVGQDDAVKVVSQAVRRARAGLKDAKRLLHVPRPNGSGQDRAGALAGRIPLRQRGRDHPPRHERVHGAPFNGAPGGIPARLCRVRRRRSAHRGRGTPPVLGRALRRDREGPSRSVQHAVADPRGWPAE